MKSIDQTRHRCKTAAASPPRATVPITVYLPAALHSALRSEGLLDADALRTILTAELERRTAEATPRPLESRPIEPDPGLALVTPAERRVLELLATHLTLAAIADRLFVSRATVKSHVASIYQKLDVSRRADAVAVLVAATQDRAPRGDDLLPRLPATAGAVTPCWAEGRAAQRLAG